MHLSKRTIEVVADDNEEEEYLESKERIVQ
jgi:hypothetical protein